MYIQKQPGLETPNFYITFVGKRSVSFTSGEKWFGVWLENWFSNQIPGFSARKGVGIRCDPSPPPLQYMYT
jgi:hypothetical protein